MSTCKVEMIQASRCINTGKEIFTLVCEYPRAIHAQLLTHNVFSKNSSSTRAVPLKAAIAQIKDKPAKYIWTDNQAGMQGEVSNKENADVYESIFANARYEAIRAANLLLDAGAHKQNAGRLLEPFQNIKIVLTSTEWENWDWLRDHEDAQGEIADLARAIKHARDNAKVIELNAGEWHVPFVNRATEKHTGELKYFLPRTEMLDGKLGYGRQISGEQAKKVSMSVCAQISYRKADYTLEKANKMEGMLLNGSKVHASPFEHQATPVSSYTENTGSNDPYEFESWEEGVTHLDRTGNLCSANFKNWIQHRQLIKNHDGANLTED
jgi:thymidylate synthase ThyX